MNFKTFFLPFLLFLVVINTQAQFSWEFYSNGNSILEDNTIRVILQSNDSSTWIGTDYGLINVKNGVWQIFKTDSSNIPDDAIRSLAFDKDDNLWVGTFLGGVGILSDTGWLNYSISDGLPDNHVRTISFDTSGKPWIGTTGGVVFLSDTGWVVYNSLNEPAFTSNNIASSVIDSETNAKWFGTINGGLMKLQDTTWTQMVTGSSGLPDNSILDLDLDTSGYLWMCTPAAGIAIYTGSSWLYFTDFNSDLPTNSISELIFSKNEDIWIATLGSGIARYNSIEGFETYRVSNSPIVSDDILSISIDHQGWIWVGSQLNGLMILKDTTTLTSATLHSEEKVDYGIEIFPTIIVDKLYVKAPVALSKQVFSIYNLFGQLVYRNVMNENEQIITINCTYFENGTYILLVENEQISFTKKLIKVKH